MNRQWVEVRLRQPGGGFTHVQLSSVGVGRESGRGMVYLTALTDVSGRIQFENERREAAEAASPTPCASAPPPKPPTKPRTASSPC